MSDMVDTDGCAVGADVSIHDKPRFEPRSRAVHEALALNRAAHALYEHEAERDGLTLTWAQVAQDGWEQIARKIIRAYKGHTDAP